MVVEIVEWTTAHWAEIAQAIASIIGAASIIVKLTPTLKDDHALKGVIRFVGKYIALNRK